MGVYEDYVYTYPDLVKAYEATGKPDFEQYVYNNQDLLDAYNKSGPKDFAKYVDSYADLAAAYRSSGSGNKENWGRNHWEQYGSKEGRTVPGNPTQSVAEWGQNHWNTYGAKEERELPKDYAQSPDQWGQKHWEGSGYKEDRILPGAKIGIDSQGKAYVANINAIGEPARARYNNLVNAFNSASDGSYKDLMQSLKGRLGEVGFKDLIENK